MKAVKETDRVKMKIDLKKNVRLLIPVAFCIILLLFLLMSASSSGKEDGSGKYQGYEMNDAELQTLSLLASIESKLSLVEERQGMETEEISALVNQLMVLNHAFLNWAERQGLIVRE